jgi:glucose/arabinose dehydrogenase
MTLRIWCGLSAIVLGVVLASGFSRGLTTGVSAQQPQGGGAGQGRQGGGAPGAQGGRQGRAGGIPIWEAPPLADGPILTQSAVAEHRNLRIAVTKGLSHPWAMVFLPDGGILVTERAGRLRLVKDGMLDPEPISGIPPVLDRNLKGLNDIVLHPRFSENHWVYFTYYKPEPGTTDAARAELARGRYDGGHALADVRDLFATSTVINTPSAARFLFGRDGTIFLAIGVPIPATRPREGLATVADAQNPASHFGKILRLNDDGSAPPDNPFAGRPEYSPEVYALGIRNSMGMAFHPDTGDLWETENGPQGGDEINIIRAGKNYGWPTVSFGRSYGGDVTGDTGPVLAHMATPDVEPPLLFWSPSLALSGIVFYRGDRFPQWRDSIFVGSLVGTQLQRIVLNQRGLAVRRYPLLFELRQRIMDVRQGPDGLLYMVTDEAAGALLRLEPV